jgi:hypothetical protein
MSVEGGPDIVTNGLVLYLDAANNRSIVSGSTTWFDLSRNGNTGSLINGPTYSSSNNGYINFDGTDDYSTCTLDNQLSSNFTFACFAKLNSFSTDLNPKALMVSQVSSYNNYWAFLGTYNSRWHWALYNGTQNPFSFVDSMNPNTTSWFYVAGVRNTITDTLDLYINGMLHSSTNDTTTSTPVYSAFNVGAQTSQTLRRSNCQISVAKVYNRALSATEIRQNYNATKGRYGL